LKLMTGDRDFRIRFVCAERLAVRDLAALVDDADELVREVARKRRETGEADGLGA